jgi:hypothetical protein
MSGVYALLGFDTTDPYANSVVEELSPSVQTQMAMMPKLLTPWQEADLISNEVEQYFVNPIENTTNVIWTAANTCTAQSFSALATAGSGGASSYWDEANATMLITFSNPGVANVMNTALMVVKEISTNVANNFMIHTNRISNVVPLDFDIDLPHYETAIGYGKMVMYIVNQTDNIQNNSPLIGSFTSLFVANTLSDYANSFVSINNVYLGSIVNNVSSLSLTDANQFANSANQVYNMMYDYRQKDIDFFQNSKMIIERYNQVSEFNRIGQTELFLINNYIGTQNLKNNLANTGNT